MSVAQAEGPTPAAGNQVTDPGEYFDRLSTNPAMVSEQLDSGGALVMKPAEMPIIDNAVNRGAGVEQNLRAVINAGGNELFGVVSANKLDPQNPLRRILVTRFDLSPEGRASIVATLRPGDTFDVGRAGLEETGAMDVSDTMSREHFSVAYTEDGKLAVKDNNSTNGTDVMGLSPAYHDVEPVDRFQTWSAKSETVAQALEATKAA